MSKEVKALKTNLCKTKVKATTDLPFIHFVY